MEMQETGKRKNKKIKDGCDWFSALESSKYEIHERFYLAFILWNISNFRPVISLHGRFPAMK